MRLISILSIILLIGCSTQISTAELSGKYLLSINGGIDTIILRADNTYTHSYVTKTGEMDNQNGTWTLEDLQAGPTVVLNNFHSLLNEGTVGEGFYNLLVKKSFGDIYLITNIDLNDGYKKQT